MATVLSESGGCLARSARCPVCGGSWPAAVEICPQDGSPLELLGNALSVELENGTRLGDYVVNGRLGQGGMSTVYSAIHPLIGKRVAIKVIAASLCYSREAVLRFVEEARSVGQLGHPNIIDIFTFGTLPDGRCYFVMEWLQGETLAERLSGAMSFAQKIDIGTQLCDALEAVHARGFVHRDLKPANIFLVPIDEDRLRVKLLDFGIAKLVAKGAVARYSTRTDVALGTPEYIAPEQARGQPVSPRSDVYALGVVLYEMFAGRLPFVADNTTDLLVQHLTDLPPSPSASWAGIPPALEALLLRMLDKDAAKRPDVREVRAGLEAVLARLSLRVEPRARRFASGTMIALLALAPLVGFETPEPEVVVAAHPIPAERVVEAIAPPAVAQPAPAPVVAPPASVVAPLAAEEAAPKAPAAKPRPARSRRRIDDRFLVDPFATRATARTR